jgi:hypothetical protein
LKFNAEELFDMKNLSAENPKKAIDSAEAGKIKSFWNRGPETGDIIGLAIVIFIVFVWSFGHIYNNYIIPAHISKGGNFESLFNEGPYHSFMTFAFWLFGICLIIFIYILIKRIIMYVCMRFLQQKDAANKRYNIIAHMVSIVLVFLGISHFLYLCSFEIYDASRRGDIVVVNRLLRKHPGLANFKTKKGDTPLHITASDGHCEIISILLNNGANIDEKNIEGNTPLHEAILFGQDKAAALLISRGAHPDERNKSNETPLSWALKYGRTDIADLLRKHGAKE